MSRAKSGTIVQNTADPRIWNMKCYTERAVDKNPKSGRIKIIKPERENDYEVQ